MKRIVALLVVIALFSLNSASSNTQCYFSAELTANQNNKELKVVNFDFAITESKIIKESGVSIDIAEGFAVRPFSQHEIRFRIKDHSGTITRNITEKNLEKEVKLSLAETLNTSIQVELVGLEESGKMFIDMENSPIKFTLNSEDNEIEVLEYDNNRLVFKEFLGTWKEEMNESEKVFYQDFVLSVSWQNLSGTQKFVEESGQFRIDITAKQNPVNK